MEISFRHDMEEEELSKAQIPEESDATDTVCESCEKDSHQGEDCCDQLREIPVPCNNVFYQTDLVSVPVKVIPFAKAGPCTTACCGSPIITIGDTCQGEVGQVCEFTITQKLCVKLPLHFGAAVKVDRPRVQCGSASEKECDCKNPCVRKCD